MIAYSLHGSSTKLAGTAGAIVQAAKMGKKPDVIIGVSGGAVLAIPFALGLYDEILQSTANFNLKDFFDVVPVKKNGKPTLIAVFRFLISLIGAFLGLKTYRSLGVQNTTKTLRKILTKERFEQYKNGDYADCYIVSVVWKNGKTVVRNAKEMDYETTLKAIEASNQLAISAQGVRVESDLEFDGGYRTQNASWWLLENIKGIKELFSVYMFAKGENELLMPEMNEPTNIFETSIGASQIQQIDNYNEEWKDETKFCKENNVTLYDFYLPTVLQSKYDTDSKRLLYLQQLAAQQVKERLK